jgi:NAD(P)-dependent dehydrogenase (short-subunit alcohol dehydrogenase family)
MLSKALAIEWAEKGLRVNALAPGYFQNSPPRFTFFAPWQAL